jgi:hypothetical protein
VSFTRKQARALLECGKRNREIMKVYSDPSHPAHDEACRYAERLLAIANAPGGADDANEPFFDAETFLARHYAGDAAASARLTGIVTGDTAPTPLDRPLPDDDGLAELRSLSPAAAQEHIRRLTANPEFGKLLTGAKDPMILAGWDLLNARAAGVTPDAPSNTTTSTPAPVSPANPAAPDAMMRLEHMEAAILADPKHPARDPANPNYQTALAERSAAYDAVLNEGGATS